MPAIARALNRAYTSAMTLFSGRGGGGSNYPLRSLMYQNTRFDWLTEAGDFRVNAIIALCLDWQARNACSVPLKVRARTARGEVVTFDDHPLLTLMDRPNPIYNGNVLKTAMIQDVMVMGNAYSYVAMNNGGKPGELYWFDARYVAPDYPNDGSAYLHSWKYTPAGTGKVQKFDPSEVVDLRIGVDSVNDRLGYSPVQAQLREICLVNLLSAYTAGVLKNSGSTNIVVAPQGENSYTPKEAEELRLSIGQRISGDMAGSPLVFTTPTTVAALGATPNDLMIRDLDQVAVARICGAFGQSPMIHGLPDAGKTYSNYREAQRAAWMRSVKPILQILADAINHRLVPFFDPSGRTFVEFDFCDCEALAEDLDLLATRARGLWKDGVAMLNEAREIAKLTPVPNGDIFIHELNEPEAGEPDDDDAQEPETPSQETEDDEPGDEPADPAKL